MRGGIVREQVELWHVPRSGAPAAAAIEDAAILPLFSLGGRMLSRERGVDSFNLCASELSWPHLKSSGGQVGRILWPTSCPSHSV